MKTFLALLCIVTLHIEALEFDKIFENDRITISKVKIAAGEEIGLHRDVYPQAVYALKGGIITRLEADGSKVDVHFPTGQTVLRPIDPPNQMHKSVNNGDEEIDLLIVQLKQGNLWPNIREDNTHDIAVDIHIHCPMSEELKSFIKSVPSEQSSSCDDFQSSFVHSMTQLIRLVESGKIMESEWSIKTGDRLPIEVAK